MPDTDSQTDALTWRVHPARERIGAAALAVAAVAAASWLTAVAMDNPWWAALAVGFFLITLHRFFLPSEYRIDAEGVTTRSFFTSAKLRWRDIRRFQHDKRGGLLSSRRRPSVLDSFQGVHLLFHANCEEVVRRIESGMSALQKSASG